MRIKTIVLLILPIFLLTSTAFNPVVYATEERKVLSQKYIGLGVDVYAPYQCYPGETITVRVRIEALEHVRNASVTVFIWGSKSEGYSPWGTSFTVLDVEDLSSGTVQDEEYDVVIPSDISPGLTYGIIFLEWSVYRLPSLDGYWDKGSFRMTYVKNKSYENLQSEYESVLSDLQNTRTLIYVFLSTTLILFILTAYFAKKKHKTKGK